MATTIVRGSVQWMGQKCDLVLKDENISCEHDTGEEGKDLYTIFNVPIEDVIGLRVHKVPGSSSANCTADLFTYQRIPSENSRKLIKEILEFSDCEDNFDTNYKTALEWREAIQLQRIKRNRQIFVTTPEQVDRPVVPLQLLVIINPFAGKKKSEELYGKVGVPLFEVAGVEIVEELITERQGHAREFIETYDLSKITGIVLASGDGILYEIVNGLMARADWETAIKTPIGLLPTGSGNGLVSSLIFEANEGKGDPLLDAIIQIINGGIQSHDIASVLTESSGLMYMAVVTHWALSGDIDIESEKFRILGGELRNLIGGLMCVALKRSYHGVLSYLPEEEEEESIENGSGHRPLPSFSLSDPIPNNWKTVEGNFVVFYSASCSHMATSHLSHPDMRTATGRQQIVYALEDVSRLQLLSAFSDAHNVLGVDAFHHMCTKAYRLTPLTPGIISIDGERIEYGTLQVQVHPGVMRLFSRKRRS